MNSIKKYQTELANVVWLCMSFIITWALKCNTITDVFVIVMSFVLIRFVEMRDDKIDVGTATTSIILAAIYILAEVCCDNDGIYSFGYVDGDVKSLSSLVSGKATVISTCLRLSGLSFLFYFCLRALLIMLNDNIGKIIEKEIHKDTQKHFLLYSFCIIMVCWLPWLLMNYPCSFDWDAGSQLMQYLGEKSITAHHPPFSTFIMGGTFLIGKFIWNADFGCFLYILLQSCFGAWVFSYGMEKLRCYGLKLCYCVAGTMSFAISPFWGFCAQYYDKDVLYAEMMTLFFILFVDLIVKKNCSTRDAILVLIVGLLAALLRNNGIFAVAPSMFALALYTKKKARKNMMTALLVVIVAYCGITKVIYPDVLGIRSGSIAEALSVPFQQTARYVKYHENEVTDEERAAIDAVLNYDELGEKYDPNKSDNIKGMYKGDGSKLIPYFKVWFKMFWKHPSTYISATLNGCYGYIAPIDADGFMVQHISTSFPGSITVDIGLRRIFSERLAAMFSKISWYCIRSPLLKYIWTPGIYTWGVIICAFILCKCRRWEAFIMLIPQIVNILVCIASPVASFMRYQLPVAAAFPFMIGWTDMLLCQQKQK